MTHAPARPFDAARDGAVAERAAGDAGDHGTSGIRPASEWVTVALREP